MMIEIFFIGYLSNVASSTAFQSEIEREREREREKEAVIASLMEETGWEDAVRMLAMQTANDFKDSLSAQGLNMDEDLFAKVLEVSEEITDKLLLSGDSFKNRSIQLWGDQFDLDELRQLADFYRTPVGKKLLIVGPEITVASMQNLMSLSEAIHLELLNRFKDQAIDSGLVGGELNPENKKILPRRQKPSAQELEDMVKETCENTKNSEKLTPVFRGTPLYPAIASRFSIEGWVELEYTVTEEGSTKDIAILNSSTGSLFDFAAISAVENYLYCPGNRDENHAIRIVFKMEGSE